MTAAEPASSPAVDDLVLIIGRVHAPPHADGALFPVETATGGFLWVSAEECEPIPQDEVQR